MTNETVSAIEIVDAQPWTASGQILRWVPGYDSGDGTLDFGRPVWRYDLAQVEP